MYKVQVLFLQLVTLLAFNINNGKNMLVLYIRVAKWAHVSTYYDILIDISWYC